MKKISFIGGYDKTDLVLYLAKILVEMNNSVLLVDATILQRSRYIVPVIKEENAYVTNFEGVDIAIGFNNFEEVKKGLGLPPSAPINYDYIFVDTDNQEGVLDFGIEQFDKNYFVTSFDVYSIKKGVEAVQVLANPIKATKVLFTQHLNKKDDEYLNYLMMGSKLEWEPEIVFFPFEVGDQTAIYMNQRVSKIKLEGLSSQYKEQLMYMAYQILQLDGKDQYHELRKVLKRVERGV